MRLPVCVFLIKHATSGEYALFDLGLWKVRSRVRLASELRALVAGLVLTSLNEQDWSETIAPEKREAYEVYEVNVEEDLDSVLEKQGVKAEDIKVIVISRASRTSSSSGIDNLNDTTLTRLRTRFGSAAIRPPL